MNAFYRNFIVLMSGTVVFLVFFACTEKAVPGECERGRIYCDGNTAKQCTNPNGTYEERNCTVTNQRCVHSLGCRPCVPGAPVCSGQGVAVCDENGYPGEVIYSCDVSQNYSCSEGRCVDGCAEAIENRSYLGCEYWAVDLDNALVSSGNAASQQFSVVVSNPRNITARVTVERNIAPPGWPREIEILEEIDVPPEGLRVINLPSAEVDGSPFGTFNTGTHSAITSNAYRIRSTSPVAAYQFNPLENVSVFSNDASILFPVTALDNKYLVLSWPQTIADTDQPENDFGNHLRAFLTIVATKPGTDVSITLSTDIVGDGDRIPAAKAGQTIRFDLDQFDVLNLETGAFGADFTGSQITSDKPISVFTGSEASDVPMWETFGDRQCCADHLEHQLFPDSSAGSRFVLARTPPRTPAVANAGGQCAVIEESDVFRILALKDQTSVFTTMAPPNDNFMLSAGQYVDLDPYCDMVVESDKPLFVGQFMRGQGTTGIPLDLPGGDPSFIMVPPVEQWRDYYVFLTPDKYAFDFITIVVPYGTDITLDYRDISSYECTKKRASCYAQVDQSFNYEIINCQLSFPLIDPSLPPGENIEPWIQNDGYHVLRATKPVGLIVSGFDKHVSYGYVGGMDLTIINVD
ncbi:IgGFc-binding protein [Myxococcota bacterium]|nr:IgGFc-binding protein [Myxococcota bacterium]MBU1497346.1 IgGFc-binding protein [Myxococcota bacterium]